MLYLCFLFSGVCFLFLCTVVFFYPPRVRLVLTSTGSTVPFVLFDIVGVVFLAFGFVFCVFLFSGVCFLFCVLVFFFYPPRVRLVVTSTGCDVVVCGFVTLLVFVFVFLSSGVCFWFLCTVLSCSFDF